MWGQLFQAALLFAAFTTVAVPAWNLWHSTSGAEWYAAGMVTLAESKLALGYERDSGQGDPLPRRDAARARHPRHRVVGAGARGAREDPRRIAGERLARTPGRRRADRALPRGLLVSRRPSSGGRSGSGGAELVTGAELHRRVRPPHLRLLDRAPGGKRLRPYRIAGIPYPERTETQHAIVSGTTGSGKTVLISDLVAQIRARGERCVLYDEDGLLHRDLPRSGPRRADEPAGRPGALLVALPGSPQSARFRHDGRGADPAAEGHRRSLLGDRRKAALRQRRGRAGARRASPKTASWSSIC